MYIRAQYRLRTSDEWTQLSPDVQYELEQSRVFVLNQKLTGESSKIDNDLLLNLDGFSQHPAAGGYMNLLRWVQEMVDLRTPTPSNSASPLSGTRLSTLFPGWTENGKLVSFFYPVSSGRHVLEPADSVALDSSLYQVELRRYWMIPLTATPAFPICKR